jgi:hypothetical protein
MGYRSDVAYTIRFVHEDDTNNKQSFYTFLAEAKANAATALCFTTPDVPSWVFEVDEENYQINFYADSVKWYDSFSEVQAHEALLSLAKEWDEDTDNHSCIAYIFVRIGEDKNDVEVREGGDVDYDWVHVSRSISRDW